MRDAARCAVAGCERLPYMTGICQMHYDRRRRHGDVGSATPARRTPTKTATAERVEMAKARWPSLAWSDSERAAATTDAILEAILDDMAYYVALARRSGRLKLNPDGTESP